MNLSGKKQILIGLKACLSIGLLSWLAAKVNVGDALHHVEKTDPYFLAGSIALMVFQLVLGGVRWNLVLRAMATPLSMGKSLTGYFVGNFFSQVLPGAIAGDAVRMWYARRENLGLSVAVNSVLLERGITVLGLIFTVTLMQPFFLQRAPNVPGSWVFPVLSAVGTLGFIGLGLLDRLPESWQKWRVIRAFCYLAVHVRGVFLKPAYGATILAVAMLSQINLSLSVWMLARGMGLNVSALDCMVLIPPVTLIMILPISIAGWGVRETAMVTAFGYIGVAGADALALSVLFGLVSLIAALPGGVLFLTSKDRTAIDFDSLEEETAGEVHKAA